jgi:hypothetical protein
VLSTLRATPDAITHWYPGVYTYNTQVPAITTVVNYQNLTPNAAVLVSFQSGNQASFTSNSSGTGTYTGATNSYRGYGLGTAGQETNIANRTIVGYSVGGVSQTGNASGGRWITTYQYEDASSQYSYSGANNDASSCTYPASNMVYSIGPASTVSGPAQFAGAVKVPAHSASHNIGLKINGALVGTGTSTQVNSSVDQTATYGINRTVASGDTYEWVVDGFGQGVQTVSVTNTGSVENPVWNGGSYTLSVSVQGGNLSGSPTPTPAATPPSAATPTPPGATPQPTAVSGSTPQVLLRNGQTGQGVIIMNPQDIYKPITDAQATSDVNRKSDVREGVKDALSDTAAAAGSGPSTNKIVDMGTAPTYTNHGEISKDKVLSAVDQTVANRDNFKGTIDPATKKLVLPTGIGNKTLQWTFQFNIAGKNQTMTFNLEPYRTYINILRDLTLFAMYLAFWVWSAYTVRSAIA